MTSCGSVVILCNEQTDQKKNHLIFLQFFSLDSVIHYRSTTAVNWFQWSGIPESKCLWSRLRQIRLLVHHHFGTGFHASSAKGPYFPLFLLLLIQSWNSVDLCDSHQIQFWDDFVFPYLHIQIESRCSSWVTCCSLHLFPFIWILPRAHCSLIQTSGCFWFTVHCKSLFLSIEDVILENQPSLLDPFFFQQDLLWDSSKHILE